MSRSGPPLLRSVLCLPASNDRALAKLASLDCDAAIVDLEDSVAAERKDAARAGAKALLASRPFTRTIVLRINDLASGFQAADLDCAADARPDAVLVPKVDRPGDLIAVAEALEERGAEDICLWAMMETPKGILNAAAIAEAAHACRLDCMVVGLNDLRRATGIRRLPGRRHLEPALMQVVMAARAFGLEPIDSVMNDYADPAAMAEECSAGADMGFSGKMLIHPAQIGPANEAFAPRDDDVAFARAVIEAFDAPQAAGLAAIAIRGEMVERLHLESARQLIARAGLIAERSKA